MSVSEPTRAELVEAAHILSAPTNVLSGDIRDSIMQYSLPSALVDNRILTNGNVATDQRTGFWSYIGSERQPRQQSTPSGDSIREAIEEVQERLFEVEQARREQAYRASGLDQSSGPDRSVAVLQASPISTLDRRNYEEYMRRRTAEHRENQQSQIEELRQAEVRFSSVSPRRVSWQAVKNYVCHCMGLQWMTDNLAFMQRHESTIATAIASWQDRGNVIGHNLAVFLTNLMADEASRQESGRGDAADAVAMAFAATPHSPLIIGDFQAEYQQVPLPSLPRLQERRDVIAVVILAMGNEWFMGDGNSAWLNNNMPLATQILNDARHNGRNSAVELREWINHREQVIGGRHEAERHTVTVVRIELSDGTVINGNFHIRTNIFGEHIVTFDPRDMIPLSREPDPNHLEPRRQVMMDLTEQKS